MSPLHRARSAALRILSEPLLHFLIAGFVVFWAGLIYQQQTEVYRIIQTPERSAHLAQRYALQFGSAPDEATLQLIIRRDVDDEMLFREGMALGLDRDDEIVRRRIVQKMQFLLNDTSAPPEPTQLQLQNYYAANVHQYERPPEVTFSHAFFSDDVPDSRPARTRAAISLGALEKSGANRAPDLGDPFPYRHDFAGYDPQQVSRLFGDTELSRAVFTAPMGQWSGPFRSGYGWHLVHIDARRAASTPSFAEVRDAVRTAYLKDQQAKENAAAFSRLAARFTVKVQDGRDGQ